jgi:uncharacterized GH25 family protein
MKQTLIALVFHWLTVLLSAHDTWLQAVVHSAMPGEALRFELTSADGFKGVDYGPPARRVQQTGLRVAGATTQLVVGPEDIKVLHLRGKSDQTGIATVWVVLTSNWLELKPELIEVYLEEIRAPKALREEWAQRPGPKIWRELYRKSAKTHLHIGPGLTQDHSWRQPAGLDLEFVAETNPVVLQAGDMVRVRLLSRGRPVPGLAVDIVNEGENVRHLKKTDGEGRVSARLTEPGRWLVRATLLRKSDQPDLEWESDFATLLLDVAARD